MDKKKNTQLKYWSRVDFILLWLILWYLMGSLYVFISTLPSVSIWSLQESVIREGNYFRGSYYIKNNSILQVIILSAIWPHLLIFFVTVGWMLAGEVVGPTYSRNSPLIILVYYIQLIQISLPIIVIGFMSGLIALFLVKSRNVNVKQDDLEQEH